MRCCISARSLIKLSPATSRFRFHRVRAIMSSAMVHDSSSVSNLGGLKWKDDAYGGIIVEQDNVPEDPAEFKGVLSSALQAWRSQGKRGIWLRISKERSSLIPVAVGLGFDFHHADPGQVMMTTWLPSDPCTLPPNASHQVGVGALVLNERGEMLAVQERSGNLKGRSIWKMPTGLVHTGEDFTEAVVREVLEETGVKATFDRVLLVRQAHGFAFGKSDMFFLCALLMEPGQQELVPQESEIEAVGWIPLGEYAQQEAFREVPLHIKISERCKAYAEGRYKGMDASKLEASLHFSSRKRQDLLVWGDDELITGRPSL